MISVVIPALNEERALPANFEVLLPQADGHEIILVDGGSTDRTLEIARKAAERHDRFEILQTERGRARQQNAGAAAAEGEWLLFLHCDTLLPPNGLGLIANQPDEVEAGCFRHRFSGRTALLNTMTWFHNHRFKFTRVIYGDQAMFIRRALFEELGGFPDRPMEDIAFSITLKRATRPIMLAESITTDSRKFEQMGTARALYRAVSLLVRFRLGRDVSNDPFFTDYR
jgi:rSAM/selenodomain-associated transferase 2